jgi:hypothetical protein
VLTLNAFKGFEQASHRAGVVSVSLQILNDLLLPREMPSAFRDVLLDLSKAP